MLNVHELKKLKNIFVLSFKRYLLEHSNIRTIDIRLIFKQQSHYNDLVSTVAWKY